MVEQEVCFVIRVFTISYFLLKSLAFSHRIDVQDHWSILLAIYDSGGSYDVKMCSVGVKTGDECDKVFHISSVGRKKLSEFSIEEQKVLSRRIDVPLAEISDPEYNICLHHEQVYLVKFSRNQSTCCNPYEVM